MEIEIKYPKKYACLPKTRVRRDSQDPYGLATCEFIDMWVPAVCYELGTTVWNKVDGTEETEHIVAYLRNIYTLESELPELNSNYYPYKTYIVDEVSTDYEEIKKICEQRNIEICRERYLYTGNNSGAEYNRLKDEFLSLQQENFEQCFETLDKPAQKIKK